MARSVSAHLAEVTELLAAMRHRIIQDPPDLLRIDDPALPGRVTARSLRSSLPLPPFDNSQMDGYAVCASDLEGTLASRPITLPLGVATAAGDAPIRHHRGTASPVMTGAAIPVGADTVVPIEACLPAQFPHLSRAGDGEPTGEIRVSAAPPLGQYIRRQGEDVVAGSEVVGAAMRLTPARIGAIAAAGIVEVPVRRRARVLLCATGDELSNGGSPLAPGRIHDANTPMLAAAIRSAGAEVRTATSSDRAEDLRDVIVREGAGMDLLVTSGGISAGAFEVVREALAPLGARFMGVAMQPGGPQGLGLLTLGDGTQLVALCFPGNPVSSLLSAELFLLPALRVLTGLPAKRTSEWRPLAQDLHSPEHKLQLRRGQILDDGSVTVTPPGSHLLSNLADAEIIVEIPVGVSFASAGTRMETWSLDA
jgi:molybdopterin molybdotransferase